MQLQVSKYEGAGNDFVAVDGRAQALPEGAALAELVRALCDRRRGIGADGALLLLPPTEPRSDFRMRYFNSDGGEADMCGNGARCIARFALATGAAAGAMTFQTAAGRYRAEARGSGIALQFPDIEATPDPRPLEALGRSWDADFLRVGVPHLVAWVSSLEEANLHSWGRALRFHPDLAPDGANVNFAEPDPGAPDRLRIRTYERGVEGETLACGTGSVASAICLARRRGLSGACRIEVVPTSGDALTIDLTLEAYAARSITLTGPAREVFTTRVAWEPGRGVQPAAEGEGR